MKKITQWLSKLSTRERTILTVTAVVFFAAAADGLVAQPILRQFQAMDQEILAAEHQVRKNLRALAVRERILESHKQSQTRRSTLGTDEEETSRLLSEIESLARASELAILNMKPQQIVPLGFGKRYAVEIEVRGDMGSLIQFLYGLHRSKAILSGEQFRLTNDKGPDSVRGSLSIIKTVLL